MADDDNEVVTGEEKQPEEETVAARPVFQPEDQGASAPVYAAELARPVRPVFQPAKAARPIFQPAATKRPVSQPAAAPVSMVPSETQIGAAQQEAWRYLAPDAVKQMITGQPSQGPPRAYTRPVLLAAEQAANYKFQSDKDALTNLFPKSGNLIEYSNRLSRPVEGVDPATQSEFAGNVRGEITKLAQEQFGEKDPDVAYQKALSDPNFGDYANEFKKKFVGSWASLLQTMQSATSPDQERLNIALEAMAPGDKAEQAVLQDQLLKADQRTRGHILQARLPYTANLDYAQLMDGLARLSDPLFQANSRQVVANTREIAKRNLQSDLRLEGTPVDTVINTLASAPANLVAFNALPPVAIKQIFDSTREQLAQDHPEYTDGELDTEAAKATLGQFVGQEVANHLFLRGAGKLIGGLQGRVTRAVAQAAINTTGGAAAMGGGQVLANIVSGQPMGQGVPQALLSGATFGGLGGVVHGAGELARPAPEVTTGPTGARIRGPTEATLEKGAAEGAAAPETAPVQPAVQPVQPEPAPAEVSAPLTEADRDYFAGRTGGATEADINYFEELERLRKSGDIQRFGDLRAQGPPDSKNVPAVYLHLFARAEDPAAARNINTGAIETAPSHFEAVNKHPEGQTMPKQLGMVFYDGLFHPEVGQGHAVSLAGEPMPRPPPRSAAPPPTSESEPIVSAIANRYTAERMARGELGAIDPSQGTSTADLVTQGLAMSPNRRETLIEDFVKGKGGDLDQQGAAIRAKEAYLSEQARAASRAAEADPGNQQLKVAASRASDEVTAFHNGPLKKFKRVWSDSGRALQQELPLDYTTLNGMKEAYLKANGEAAPQTIEPALAKIAKQVGEASEAERVAMQKFGQEIAAEVKKRGRRLPTNDEVRAELAAIMKDSPCPS